MPTPRVTIDQLPEQAVPEDDNLLIVHDAGITKKLAVSSLKALTSDALVAHLDDVSDAHDASAISATPSGPGVDGPSVQAQLGQLATKADAALNQTEADARYLTLTGGDLSGDLDVAGDIAANTFIAPNAPVINEELTNKAYVDAEIAALEARIDSQIAILEARVTALENP